MQSLADAGGQRTLEQKILRATLRCLARWGIAKTSMEDVAKEAGVSRATVYRFFPGGKGALVEQAADLAVELFFAGFEHKLAGAADLESKLAVGIAEGARAFREREGIRAVLMATFEDAASEGGLGQLGRVIRMLAASAAPHLEPYVGPSRALQAGEWVARVALSYTTCPSDQYDLSSEDSVRRLVRDLLLPALAGQPATAGQAV